MTTPTAQTNEYVLGTNETERVRLLTTGELYRGAAGAVFDRVGAGEGWRTIDIGCGPLGVLDVLAERVGPSGTVLGLERGPRMLEMAEVSLAERRIEDVELVRADAVATGLPGGSFDLVHARLVLCNVTNPSDIVTEMARLARPGGYVVVQDVDVLSWMCEPPHRAWTPLHEAFVRSWVGDVRIGRRLPGMLRQGGLNDVGVDARAQAWQPGDEPFHKLLLYWIDLCRDRILATGELTGAELEGHVRELETHLEDPDTITVYPTLVQVWGRKAHGGDQLPR